MAPSASMATKLGKQQQASTCSTSDGSTMPSAARGSSGSRAALASRTCGQSSHELCRWSLSLLMAMCHTRDCGRLQGPAAMQR